MIKIYVDVKAVTFGNGKDKKTFDAYKTQIGKLNMDVKFTKESEIKKPTKSGYVTIPTTNLSLDTSKDFPVLWIR